MLYVFYVHFIYKWSWTKHFGHAVLRFGQSKFLWWLSKEQVDYKIFLLLWKLGRLLAYCWLKVDQQLTNSRLTVGQLSADYCWQLVDCKSTVGCLFVKGYCSSQLHTFGGTWKVIVVAINFRLFSLSITLVAESLWSFLDKSGKRKRLCWHLQIPLICRSSCDLDESDKFLTG